MAHIFVDNAVSAFIVHEPADRVLKQIGWQEGKITAPADVYATFVGKGGTDVHIKPTSVIVVADED
jgi:hypothetical protein